MGDLIKTIQLANDEELSQIILEIIARYGALHPDWEVIFLSLPKNDLKERRRCIRAAVSMLKNENRRAGA